jgi:hypothetical protein
LQLAIELQGLILVSATQIIDPNAGVDDDHADDLFVGKAAFARFTKITFPLHLAAQPADGALGMRLSQQAQPCLNGCFFGSGATAPHGSSRQAIIDIDIGTHSNYGMCIDSTIVCITLPVYFYWSR